MNPLRSFLINLLSKKKHKMPAIAREDCNYYFSQFGEDIALNRFFAKKNHGFYVDIGCYKPVEWSNTYFLYQKGWKGIVIDPNDSVIAEFKKHRPEDIALCTGITDKESTANYHRFDVGAFNTLCDKTAEQWKKSGAKHISTTQIKTHPLSQILDKYVPSNTAVDFLNIDCEGYDLFVLKSNNWKKYRPSVIAVEDHGDSVESETKDYLENLDYKLFSWIGPTKLFKDTKSQ